MAANGEAIAGDGMPAATSGWWPAAGYRSVIGRLSTAVNRAEGSRRRIGSTAADSLS
jgi:hypothetical protein